MTTDSLIHYCLKKDHAYLDYPFGKSPVCIKVNNRIFAEVYTQKSDCKVTLKCDPHMSYMFRSQYPRSVVSAYHISERQRPLRNTVYINKEIPDSELLQMIDHSYREVVKGTETPVIGRTT